MDGFCTLDRYAALLGVSLFLAVGLTACQRRAASQAETRQASIDEDAPAHESWNVKLHAYEDDRPRMAMHAGHLARYDRDDSTYTLLRPHPDSTDGRVAVFLFGPEGDTSTTVQADRIFYYDEERRFEAREQVVATTSSDKRLETEHLHWNGRSERVRAPGFVRITTPQDRIEGYKLEGDEHLDNYRIADVTGQVTLKE